MSDRRLPPSVSDGTSWVARFGRAAVLGTIRAAVAVTGGHRTHEGPVPQGPSVVAFHHTSPVDAFMIGMPIWKAGGHPIAMVKASVFRNPISGPIVRSTGMIPVARKMAESRQLAYDASLVHLEKGHVVHIAPHGTITPVAEVGEWRAGAARLAQEAGVPLVPAVVFGPERWGGVPGENLRFAARVDVHVCFGEPIEVGPERDVAEATEEARQVVSAFVAARAQADTARSER